MSENNLEIALAEALVKYFPEIIRAHFPGGIMPSSILDRKKFARCFLEMFQQKHQSQLESEEELRISAEACCVPVGKKFYAVSPRCHEVLEEIFAELAVSGVNTVFYSRLYDRHASVLEGLLLSSSEIMAQYIKKFFRFPANDEYFCLDPGESMEAEILRKTAASDLLDERDLDRLFPYIPRETVQTTMLESSQFVKTGPEAFLNAETVEFAPRELERELARLQKGVAEDGYYPLANISLAETCELYPHLPENGIRAVFLRQLTALDLEVHGKIIRRQNEKQSLTKVLEKFCKKYSEFNFKDLQNSIYKHIQTVEIRHLRNICFKNYIQINNDYYVSLDAIEFDIEKIDTTILNLTNNKPFSCLSFNEYCFLPNIDYPWNSFLLQSYLYHKSKVFSICWPAINNKCISIVYNKNDFSNPDYYKLAANIALSDGITPDYMQLSEYVISNGILAHCRKSAILSIIHHMCRY